MTKVTMIFTFKDGSRAEHPTEFAHDARSDIFLGMSQGFKNNGDIIINDTIKRKYDDVKSFEIIFHD